MTTASDPSLLPASFKKSLPDPNPKGDPVSLGDLEALRYSNLKPNNYPQQLTIYAVPTDSGVATVACSASAAQAASFLPQCEAAASTLTLSGTQAVDLGVPQAYAKALDSTIQRLQAERAAALKKASAAGSPAAQAGALRQAAAAYAAAARTLAGQKGGPQVQGANTAIIARLRQGAIGYTLMAAGAASNNPARYRSGQRAVGSADAGLRNALKALSQTS
jgi:hypothetical protein